MKPTIANDPEAKVANLWVDNRWTPNFRRALGPRDVEDWQQLATMHSNTTLPNEEDTVSWSLEPSGEFFKSSLYREISKSAP